MIVLDVRTNVDGAACGSENVSRHVVENSDLIVGVGFESAMQMMKRAFDRLFVTADLQGTTTTIVVNVCDVR